jgi:hypothetical protein
MGEGLARGRLGVNPAVPKSLLATTQLPTANSSRLHREATLHDCVPDTDWQGTPSDA